MFDNFFDSHQLCKPDVECEHKIRNQETIKLKKELVNVKN